MSTTSKVLRRALLAAALVGVALVLGLRGTARADSPVPAPGESKRIDEIKQRGMLRVAVLGEYPWLKENIAGGGEPFEGPAWMLAKDYAKRLGVRLEPVTVSHETKVPILATGQVDMTIAPLSVTPAREKVVDFVVYSTSALCLFGKGSNQKLAAIEGVNGLNDPSITIAYFTGTPPENWLPERFPKAQRRAVTGSGANAPVDEIMSGRADVAPIDKVAWVDLAAKVPGLVVYPPGDECLKSNELPTAVGLAIDQNQPAFLAWLTAVAKDLQPELEAEELRVMKVGS
jgi:polar amino acid transport system substrate-binding protein